MSSAKQQFQAARQGLFYRRRHSRASYGFNFAFAAEFKELSIGDLKTYEDMFKKYDTSTDGYLDLQELKYLMEQIGQT